MTVSDYAFAALCLIASLFACGLSGLFAMFDEFHPTPDRESTRIAQRGCLGVIAFLVAAVYFAGVLISGSWGWIS